MLRGCFCCEIFRKVSQNKVNENLKSSLGLSIKKGALELPIQIYHDNYPLHSATVPPFILDEPDLHLEILIKWRKEFRAVLAKKVAKLFLKMFTYSLHERRFVDFINIIMFECIF